VWSWTGIWRQGRLEPGDLVGLGVHVALAEDRAGGVVHRGEQVDLLLAVVAAAAEGLAVDGDRLPRRVGWWRWLLAGQPGADGAGQHAAHGGLAWWPEGIGPRVAADPECGQHLAGRVRCPLTDRGQRSGPGQHCGHRHGQHRGQGVASAAPVAGVGDLGEVAEQVTVLLGCQCRGCGEPVGSNRNGG
jgi:hypothetical protein